MVSEAVILAALGVFAALLTGAVARVFDYRLGRKKQEFDEIVHSQEREVSELLMLKTDLLERKREIRELEHQLDEWKEKYYKLLQTLIEIRSHEDG